MSQAGRPREARPCALGKRILAHIADAGSSVDALAEQIGVTRQTVYRWIAGTEPKGLQRKALLGVLDHEEGRGA